MPRAIQIRSSSRRRLACGLVLAGAVTSAVALAAAPPAIRSVPPGMTARPAASGFSAVPGAEPGPGRVCGARVEGALDLIQQRIERTLVAPEPTVYSTDTAGIAVLEDDGTFFYAGPGSRPVLDVARVAQVFYQTHADEYDALAIYLTSGLSTWLGSSTALAANYLVQNDVSGIGLESFDLHEWLATPPGLHTLLSMNGLDRYPDDPDQVFNDPGDTFTAMDVLAHEYAHRWLAYVYVDSAGLPVPALLGRDYQHWNFFADVDSSVMEGCDWISPAPDSFLTDGVTNGYGRLDQYLMGLRTKAEIDSFFVVNEPYAFNPPGTYIPTSIPEVGIGCRGTATWWRVSDIEGAEGARVPDAASSPHAFHVAVLLVTPHGSPATDADLTKLGVFRSRFVSYFETATGGRATMDVTLGSRAGHVRIATARLPDTEDFAIPRALGTRVSIDQGGIRLAVDPASVRAFMRIGVGGWSAFPMIGVAPDSFVATLPAVPPGGTVEYYVYAASDSIGIDATDPPAGAAAPYRYFAGPDVIPPLVVHVPMPSQTASRLPVTLLARITDNGALDSTWIETSVNGGPSVTLPLVSAGRDSFSAAIGAGLKLGDRLAYRFVARDHAAIPNYGFSNAAFDTLVAGTDWIEDFENGIQSGWVVSRQRRRDPWCLTQQRAFGGSGTAWKAGALDTLPYPPHLDGALDTPYLIGVDPAAVLTFEHWWDLEAEPNGIADDGAILEVQIGYSGTWQLVPRPSYTHTSEDVALGMESPCWSGSSGGWRSEAVSMAPYAPGPVRFRFHMAADDFVGREGWYVDHVRLVAPGSPVALVPADAPAFRVAPPAPNPAGARIRQGLTLARPANVSWELFDPAGRRVAVLWRGPRGEGAGELSAALPREVTPGLYFLRVAIDGAPRAIARVAVVR